MVRCLEFEDFRLHGMGFQANFANQEFGVYLDPTNM